MRERYTISTLTVVAYIAVSAMLAGCSETSIYKSPRPTSAELSIEVIGADGVRRWVVAKRIDYIYSDGELNDEDQPPVHIAAARAVARDVRDHGLPADPD